MSFVVKQNTHTHDYLEARAKFEDLKSSTYLKYALSDSFICTQNPKIFVLTESNKKKNLCIFLRK